MYDVKEALKHIIDSEGLNYLNTNAYKIYCNFLENKVADAKTARLVLMTLLADVQKQKMQDKTILSAYIQEKCCFQKNVADELADFYMMLFSTENVDNWKNNTEEGFHEFCKKEWHFDLRANETWYSGGVHVDAECFAEADLKISDADLVYKALGTCIKENPFLSPDRIYNYFAEKLQDKLNEDFRYYVICEDYYPPVAEDYYDNFVDWLLSFCKEYGFELSSFDFDGETSDYIPDFC